MPSLPSSLFHSCTYLRILELRHCWDESWKRGGTIEGFCKKKESKCHLYCSFTCSLSFRFVRIVISFFVANNWKGEGNVREEKRRVIISRRKMVSLRSSKGGGIVSSWPQHKSCSLPKTSSSSSLLIDLSCTYRNHYKINFIDSIPSNQSINTSTSTIPLISKPFPLLENFHLPFWLSILSSRISPLSLKIRPSRYYNHDKHDSVCWRASSEEEE